MTIYFTSDQHFWHNNIIRYCDRPFSSVEEMNECIINKYNCIVKPYDTVYFIGDFSMAFRPVELFLPRLNGHKHLIAGNHDFCHPAHKKGKKDIEKWTNMYLNAGFESINLSLIIQYKNESILLNHMPYKSDHSEIERYNTKNKEYRPENKGLLLLHGHVHTLWLINDNQINVGVDQWNMEPVSIEEILELRDLVIANKK